MFEFAADRNIPAESLNLFDQIWRSGHFVAKCFRLAIEYVLPVKCIYVFIEM